ISKSIRCIIMRSRVASVQIIRKSISKTNLRTNNKLFVNQSLCSERQRNSKIGFVFGFYRFPITIKIFFFVLKTSNSGVQIRRKAKPIVMQIKFQEIKFQSDRQLMYGVI